MILTVNALLRPEAASVIVTVMSANALFPNRRQWLNVIVPLNPSPVRTVGLREKVSPMEEIIVTRV